MNKFRSICYVAGPGSTLPQQTHPLRTRNHVGQRHGYRELSLVSHHRDQLYQPLKPVSQHRFCKGVKFCALLEDFCQNFHKCSSCLKIFVVT